MSSGWTTLVFCAVILSTTLITCVNGDSVEEILAQEIISFPEDQFKEDFSVDQSVDKQNKKTVYKLDGEDIFRTEGDESEKKVVVIPAEDDGILNVEANKGLKKRTYVVLRKKSEQVNGKNSYYGLKAVFR